MTTKVRPYKGPHNPITHKTLLKKHKNPGDIEKMLPTTDL